MPDVLVLLQHIATIGCGGFNAAYFAARWARKDSSHRVGAAAKRAEEVAAQVALKEGMHFVRARGVIRKALADDGVSAHIDRLVAQLLGS